MTAVTPPDSMAPPHVVPDPGTSSTVGPNPLLSFRVNSAPSFATMVNQPIPGLLNLEASSSSSKNNQFVFGNMDDNSWKIVLPKDPTTFNGMPYISFYELEVNSLARPFERTIVGKFS